MGTFVTGVLAAPTLSRRRAGNAVAALLAADALVHTAWAAGLTWPAHDHATLSHAVLNADVPFTLPVLLPLVALLTAASTGVLAHSRDRGGPAVRRLAHLMTGAVAAGLTLRAAAGLVWLTGVDADPSSTFYRLNAALYTPACLVFGGLALRALGPWRLRRATAA